MAQKFAVRTAKPSNSCPFHFQSLSMSHDIVLSTSRKQSILEMSTFTHSPPFNFTKVPSRRTTSMQMSSTQTEDVFTETVGDGESPLFDQIYTTPTPTTSTEASSEEENWVPPAYRGLLSDIKKGSNRRAETIPFRRSSWRLDRPPTKSMFAERENRVESKHGREILLESYESERIATAVRENEENISLLYQKLVRLTAQYRSHFDTDFDPTNNTVVDPILANLPNRILNVLNKLPLPDGNITQKQVKSSEEDFRALCKVLRHLCSLACGMTNLTKYNEKETKNHTELAEFLLVQIAKLIEYRASAIQAAATKAAATQTTMPSADELPLTPTSGSRTVTGWFHKLVEDWVPSLTAPLKMNQKIDTVKLAEEQDTEPPSTQQAMDDSRNESINRLLQIVIRNIAAATVPTSYGIYSSDLTDSASHNALPTLNDPNTSIVAAQRMMGLLDAVSSFLPPNPEALRYVMETLCRAGTLQGARMCQKIFQQYSGVHCRLQFALVLEAYLQAIQQESDLDKSRIVAEEVMDLLSKQWNILRPTHRVERILHCSIVFNCLAVADMGKIPGVCERADGIVKRALGSSGYASFRREVDGVEPMHDTQFPPIANFLAQLYASSSDVERVHYSKKLLRSTMYQSGFLSFPNLDTCNAVISALLQLYDVGEKKEDSEILGAAQADFAFVQEVLELMLVRSDTVCVPNAATQDLILRFLEVVNPPDIGAVAERLISMIETRQLVTKSHTDKVTLSTYHRLLMYWLQEAKNSTVTDAASGHVACERAFRLLRKLELQSMPMVLSDSALGASPVKNLYDISLRPMRKTYKMVMQVCADTSRPENYEKAADIALTVQRMMLKRRFACGDDTTSLLTVCASRLDPGSKVRLNIEEVVRFVSKE